MRQEKLLHTAPCDLCLERHPLVRSHLIPKFVTDWISETSPRKQLLEVADGEVVYTKGVTFPAFCARCDNERLGDFENRVAPVFRARVEHPDQLAQPLTPDSAMAMCQFALGMHFRSLLHYREGQSGLDSTMHEFRRAVLSYDRGPNDWRYTASTWKHFAILLPEVTVEWLKDRPALIPPILGINWYLWRTMDSWFDGPPERVHAYSKLPGLLLMSARADDSVLLGPRLDAGGDVQLHAEPGPELWQLLVKRATRAACGLSHGMKSMVRRAMIAQTRETHSWNPANPSHRYFFHDEALRVELGLVPPK